MSSLSVEDICKRLKPILGKKVDELYFRYSVSTDRDEKEEIVNLLGALYQKNFQKLLDQDFLLEPPSEEQMDGEYNLAQVSYAGKKLFPFKLREKDWQRHVCISGMSGSGKTTLALNILKQFILKNKPFLVFDWKKSFRPLMNVDTSIISFTIGDDAVANKFKTNINRPPKGVSPKEWINVLCDLLVESFGVSFGVHKILLETLDEAFEEWGIYEGSENYPTWKHIKWRLEEKEKQIKGRETGWLESALRIATVLTFGAFGEVVNYKEAGSIQVEDLLNQRVIFELNSLGNIEKKFFCEFVLTYLYKMKKAQKASARSSFDYAILVDEAHNIFLKDKTNFTQESVTDMVYREMREYGISLICLDQHISKISDTVKGNSACNIAFQQQLPQDIWDISGIMQLKERKELFSHLPVGSAVVRLSERFTSPFLVEVPFEKLREKEIEDSVLQKRTETLSQGIEVETNKDLEFKQELMAPRIVEAPKSSVVQKIDIPQYSISEIPQIPETFPLSNSVISITKIPDNSLTPAQNILYDFVNKKLSQGRDLLEIERLLNDNVNEDYSEKDVICTINKIIENQLNSVQSLQKETLSSAIIPSAPIQFTPSSSQFSEDEAKLINFLKTNPDHEQSVVAIYKLLNFSARKGDKIKKDLLRQNCIKIHEQRNKNGWKKIIRLNL